MLYVIAQFRFTVRVYYSLDQIFVFDNLCGGLISNEAVPKHVSKFEPTRRTMLKTTAGVGFAASGLGLLTGSAAAHFPAELTVDVKPGSDDNPINPRSNGVISVAVLQTDAFDPTSEDVRYRFGAPEVVGNGGGSQPAHGGHVEDVNGDGRKDLVLHFPINEAGFDGDESEGELRWDRDESREHGLSGRDSVTIVGRR